MRLDQHPESSCLSGSGLPRPENGSRWISRTGRWISRTGRMIRSAWAELFSTHQLFSATKPDPRRQRNQIPSFSTTASSEIPSAASFAARRRRFMASDLRKRPFRARTRFPARARSVRSPRSAHRPRSARIEYSSRARPEFTAMPTRIRTICLTVRVRVIHAGRSQRSAISETFRRDALLQSGRPSGGGFFDLLRWKLTSRPERSPRGLRCNAVDHPSA